MNPCFSTKTTYRCYARKDSDELVPFLGATPDDITSTCSSLYGNVERTTCPPPVLLTLAGSMNEVPTTPLSYFLDAIDSKAKHTSLGWRNVPPPYCDYDHADQRHISKVHEPTQPTHASIMSRGFYPLQEHDRSYRVSK